MQALKLFMDHHIEFSESKSWFNNNQSHHFKQFLLSHSQTWRWSTTQSFSLLYIILLYLKQECVGSTNVLTKQYFVTAPVFSFHLPACSTSSWHRLFLIYFHITSHKFASFSLKKTMCFFPWFLMVIPLILFL